MHFTGVFDNQAGRLPGRSTDDQLLLTYNYISQHWDSGHIVDHVLCDFSKAFDTANHAILSFTPFRHSAEASLPRNPWSDLGLAARLHHGSHRASRGEEPSDTAFT